MAKTYMTFADIQELNRSLSSLHEKRLLNEVGPSQPTLFIIGVPRSGTTFLTQLLSCHTSLGYITNFVAHCWDVPATAMAIQKTLETEIRENQKFSSYYGATSGMWGPHEFGYFWRRWFQYKSSHKISIEDEKQIDISRLQKEVAAMESVWGGPLFFKNLAACGMNAAFLSKVFPKAIFLVVKRDANAVLTSLLKARQVYHGDYGKWFSIQPQGYDRILDMAADKQVMWQLNSIEEQLLKELSDINPSHLRQLQYDDLISHPLLVMQSIIDWINEFGSNTKFKDLQVKNTRQNVKQEPLPEWLLEKLSILPDDFLEKQRLLTEQFMKITPPLLTATREETQ